jgi:hypothetical protein
VISDRIFIFGILGLILGSPLGAKDQAARALHCQSLTSEIGNISPPQFNSLADFEFEKTLQKLSQLVNVGDLDSALDLLRSVKRDHNKREVYKVFDRLLVREIQNRQTDKVIPLALQLILAPDLMRSADREATLSRLTFLPSTGTLSLDGQRKLYEELRSLYLLLPRLRIYESNAIAQMGLLSFDHLVSLGSLVVSLFIQRVEKEDRKRWEFLLLFYFTENTPWSKNDTELRETIRARLPLGGVFGLRKRSQEQMMQAMPRTFNLDLQYYRLLASWDDPEVIAWGIDTLQTAYRATSTLEASSKSYLEAYALRYEGSHPKHAAHWALDILSHSSQPEAADALFYGFLLDGMSFEALESSLDTNPSALIRLLWALDRWASPLLDQNQLKRQDQVDFERDWISPRIALTKTQGQMAFTYFPELFVGLHRMATLLPKLLDASSEDLGAETWLTELSPEDQLYFAERFALLSNALSEPSLLRKLEKSCQETDWPLAAIRNFSQKLRDYSELLEELGESNL